MEEKEKGKFTEEEAKEEIDVKKDSNIPESLIEEAVKSVEEVQRELEKSEEIQEEFQKKINELNEEIKNLQKENEELKDKLLRLAADFDNYRKRVEKEKEEIFNYGHSELIKDILLVIDNLERAIEAAESKKDVESLLEGVKLTLNSFWSTIKKYGVEPLDAEGKPFDPNYHEAMTLVETDEVKPGVVIKEFQKGYMIKDRLLRPSRVAVSAATRKEGKDEENDSV